MADEDLTLRASVDDAMSAPLERIEGQIHDVGDAAAQAGRKAGSEGASGMGRFERATDRLRSSVGRLDERLKTASRTLDRHLGQALRRTGVGLGLLAGTATLFGVKAASSFQATQLSFETLLGSAEKGRALFKELQAINLKTPFELSDLAAGEQLLLRYNIQSDRATKVLKGLVDVAALSDAPAENLNRMARAVGQIFTSGRLQGQDALQLVQAGINAYDIYAKKLGITQAEARKLGEAGKLDAGILLDAIAELDGPLEKFRGGAEKMSKTLTGQLSNLKDALNVGLADAAQPLVEQLGRLIGSPEHPGALVSGLTSLVTNVGPPLFTLVGSLANLLAKALPALQPILSAIAGGLDRLLTAAGPSLAALEPLGDKIGDSLVQLVDALVPVMPDLVDLFVALVGVLPTFVQMLTLLVPLVVPIANLATGLLKFKPLRAIFAGLLGVLIGYRVLSGVATSVRAFGTALGFVATQQAKVNATAAIPGAPGGGGARGAGGRLGSIGVTALTLMDANAIKNIVTGVADEGVHLQNPFARHKGDKSNAEFAKDLFFGDSARPARARDGAAEAATPGSRTMTSNHRRFAVGPGSGHLSGTAFDRAGSWMGRYRENVRAQGGWAVQERGHVHADFGDSAAPPHGSAPAGYAAGMGGGGGPLVYVAGNVYGMDDLEGWIRAARRRQDEEDLRRARRVQGRPKAAA